MIGLVLRKSRTRLLFIWCSDLTFFFLLALETNNLGQLLNYLILTLIRIAKTVNEI